MQLPDSWQPALGEELKKPYFASLRQFLNKERARHKLCPPEGQMFNALKLTPFGAVKVVILGQDPYHNDGQAHGLAFSVPQGVKPPPSLVNIFKELKDDLGVPIPDNGCLIHWALQGVLLLNIVLTARAHEPLSHRGKGWELFTDAVIRALNDRARPVLFVLWGGPAQKKRKLIASPRHGILESAHPSPLSARRGFLGSRPFSAINRTLAQWGEDEVDWRLPGA
ncbi:MAG: uracil-DNA glycosylase [Planctomycetes bacterium]|nr:uracil-DNA glycosylase [Planctomycetota bacterium]